MITTTELDAATWRSIAHAWNAISTVPVSQPDGALEQLWPRLQALMEFDACYVVLAQRTPRTRRAYARGYVNGWLLAEFFYGAGDWAPVFAASVAEDWHEQIARDPWLVALTDGAGTHRTLLREDIFADADWQTYIQRGPTQPIGTTERLTSAFAVDPQVEVYLGFLRRGTTRFTERDRRGSHTLHTGLGELWRRLVMSYGLLEHQTMLAPRERETLLLLLEGLAEHDIAETLGLSVGTVHQYVVSVFRSFGVSSRPELTSAWMGER